MEIKSQQINRQTETRKIRRALAVLAFYVSYHVSSEGIIRSRDKNEDKKLTVNCAEVFPDQKNPKSDGGYAGLQVGQRLKFGGLTVKNSQNNCVETIYGGKKESLNIKENTECYLYLGTRETVKLIQNKSQEKEILLKIL